MIHDEIVTYEVAKLAKEWVFGFDTIHAGDSLNTWPKERVIAETENLRKLLEDWGENED